MRGQSEAIEEQVSSPAQMLMSETEAVAVQTPAASSRKERDLLETMPDLPCMLTLELPVVRFTIAHLLKLAPGAIVETACHHTSDVPLRVNQTLIGWTEFDVIDDRLAVRITDQA